MPNIKIDMTSGVFEAEGSEDFLRYLMSEFRTFSLSTPSSTTNRETPADAGDDTPATSPKRAPARRSKRKLSAPSEGASGGTTNYSPSVKKGLDLNGIKEFVAPFELKTHPEKILAYSVFLRDKKEINPIEADDIFTAYRYTQEKPAGAFLQSIRDTSHKKDWVDYQSPTHITVTPLGDTHFLHDLPKKG